MSTTVGLYYPFIHFRSDAWVKLAALYWDRMGRIVPKDYETNDSPTVQELKDKLDFVWDEAPGSETKTVGEQFIALLDRHTDAIREHYGLQRMMEWPDDPQTVGRAGWRHHQLAYIYNPKLWVDLTGRLVNLGLAVSQWDGDREWIGMHPKLVSVYMSALAEEMGRHRLLSPVADDSVNHLAAGGWSMERLAAVLLDDSRLTTPAHQPAEIEQGLAHIALTTVVPTNLASIFQ